MDFFICFTFFAGFFPAERCTAIHMYYATFLPICQINGHDLRMENPILMNFQADFIIRFHFAPIFDVI